MEVFSIIYLALVILASLVLCVNPSVGLSLLLLMRASVGEARDISFHLGPFYLTGLGVFSLVLMACGVIALLFHGMRWFRAFSLQLVFFVISALFLFRSIDIAETITSFFKMFTPFVIMVVASSSVKKLEDAEKLLSLMILSSLPVDLYGLYQLFSGTGFHRGGGNRIKSFFSFPNSYGFYLVAVLIAILYFVLRGAKSRKGRMFYWALFFVNVSCLLFTGTRTALLGFVCGGIAFLFMEKRLGALIIGGIGILFLIQILVIVAPHSAERLAEPIRDVPNFLYGLATGSLSIEDVAKKPVWEQTTWEGRIVYWYYLSAAVKARPFIGYGLGTSDRISKHVHNVPHNDYMRLAVESGLIGLIIYVSSLLSTLLVNRRAARRSRDEYLRRFHGAAVSIAIAFFVIMLSDNVIQANSVLWYYFSIIGLGLGLARLSEQGAVIAASSMVGVDEDEGLEELNAKVLFLRIR